MFTFKDLDISLNGASAAKLVKYGQALHDVIVTAEREADAVSKRALVRAAVAVAEDAQKAKAVLDAYAEAYKKDGLKSVDTRKSEAKAVFEAVALTYVSGKWQQLDQFQGTRADMITLARSLRDEAKKETASTAPKPRNKPAPRPLSDKAAGELVNTLKKANPAQLEKVCENAAVNALNNAPVEKVGDKLVSMAGVNMLKQIRATAQVMLRSDNIDPVYKKAAEDILAIADGVIDAESKALAAAKQALRDAANAEAQAKVAA